MVNRSGSEAQAGALPEAGAVPVGAGEASGAPALGDEINLRADDYTLFALPPGFALDRAALEQRWKQLQRLAHPDRHAAQGAAAQRLALQWSVRINEAYQRLKDPIKRGAYWCELQGQSVGAHDNTAMPAAFLVQQMQWREALAEAGSAADLSPLQAELEAERAQRLAALQAAIDVQRDARAAAQQVRALLFIERFEQQLHERLDRY